MSEPQVFLQCPLVDAMQWAGDNYEALSKWMFSKRHDVRCADRPISSISNDKGMFVFCAGKQSWTVTVGGWVVLGLCGWSGWAEHAFAASHRPFGDVE